MDPSCSLSNCDICEVVNPVPFNIKAENKTDSDTNMVDREINTQSSVRQGIDDIEREDFEEENRIINQCSSMLVDGKSAATAHYSGSLSVNSSLASSSETISTFPVANDYSLPGCSKSSACEDSNATIKNMIHSRKPLNAEEPKVDFMQKLLSSNTHEMKDFPKGKMYKAEPELEVEAGACGLEAASGRTSSNASNSSSLSDSTKDFSVPSTSNAEKLLGLTDNARKNEPGSSKSSNYMQYCEGEEDSEEDVDEESWCTCLSSHEDDDEEEGPEHEPERLWEVAAERKGKERIEEEDSQPTAIQVTVQAQVHVEPPMPEAEASMELNVSEPQNVTIPVEQVDISDLPTQKILITESQSRKRTSEYDLSDSADDIADTRLPVDILFRRPARAGPRLCCNISNELVRLYQRNLGMSATPPVEDREMEEVAAERTTRVRKRSVLEGIEEEDSQPTAIQVTVQAQVHVEPPMPEAEASMELNVSEPQNVTIPVEQVDISDLPTQKILITESQSRKRTSEYDLSDSADDIADTRLPVDILFRRPARAGPRLCCNISNELVRLYQRNLGMSATPPVEDREMEEVAAERTTRVRKRSVLEGIEEEDSQPTAIQVTVQAQVHVEPPMPEAEASMELNVSEPQNVTIPVEQVDISDLPTQKILITESQSRKRTSEYDLSEVAAERTTRVRKRSVLEGIEEEDSQPTAIQVTVQAQVHVEPPMPEAEASMELNVSEPQNVTIPVEQVDISDLPTQKILITESQSRKRTSEYDLSPKRQRLSGYVSFRQSQQFAIETSVPIIETEKENIPGAANIIQTEQHVDIPIWDENVRPSNAEKSLKMMLEKAGLADLPMKVVEEQETAPQIVATKWAGRRNGSESSETSLGSLDHMKVSLGDSEQITDSKKFIRDQWGTEGTIVKILHHIKVGLKPLTVKKLIEMGPVLAGYKSIIAARCFTSILELKQHGFVIINKDPETLEIKDILLGPRFNRIK